MSRWTILQRFLDQLLYPCQELRRKREEQEQIISAYRKNCSRIDPDDLDSPGEYETLVGYQFEYLDDEVEKKHYDLERDLKKYDSEVDGGSTGPTRRRLGPRGGKFDTYTVPPDRKEEIRERMQEIIKEIDQQTSRRIYEYAICGFYVLLVLIMIVTGMVIGIWLSGSDLGALLNIL